ncbi:MAG: hypothetical protein P1V20_19310 [Verrucomicrobiales bacterium]|nr:hypothetical protein [Verrucomicrobiales bacterium]
MLGQLRSRTEIEYDKVRLAYSRNRARGVEAINKRYIPQFEEAQKRALQKQNIEQARKFEAAIKDLQGEIDFIRKTENIRNGRIPLTLEVESLNDGSDEFHVTKHGIKWVNLGAAKAGRHLGRDEPTYINGKPWQPNWDEGQKERGHDISATNRMEMIPELLRYELLAIGNHRGSTDIESRSPTSGHYDVKDDVFIVSIPDNEGSSRWYRFKLFYIDLIDLSSEIKLPEILSEEFQSYSETRSEGILKLNQLYISSLEKLKISYIKEENLERVEDIAKLVGRLQKENEELISK